MRRKRLSQEWVRSTTQRRARKPASCLIACASSPRPRMWGEGELLAEVAHLGVVVAAIEAEPLRLLRCRRRSHDRDRLDRGPSSLKSFRFAPADAIPSGTPVPSVRSDRFAPFCSISGIGPGQLAAQRGLTERAVHRQPLPLDPLLFVVGEQPLPPELEEHAGVGPLAKAPIGPTS